MRKRRRREKSTFDCTLAVHCTEMLQKAGQRGVAWGSGGTAQGDRVR